MEWNARESSKGSVGMWDSHFRVGGAIGSNLQQEPFAKKSGAINPDCKADDERCYSSWALRIVDSTAVYVLGAGLYSSFRDYSQACLDTNDCQRRGVEIQESSDLWIYNLCTKAIIEMVTPTGGIATLAQDNMNGFLSSILAWLEGSEETSGRRDFPGFPVYTLHGLRNQILPDPCKTAQDSLRLLGSVLRRAGVPRWFDNVNANCEGYTVAGDIPTLYGRRMWAGYNGTCLTDPETGRYCNDVVAEFTTVSSIDNMPEEEMCTDGYINRVALMQASPYSVYDKNYKSDLELVYKRCGQTGNTTIPPPIISVPEQSTMCLSDKWHTVGSCADETCEDVAFLNNVSTVSLYTTNPDIFDCSSILSGTELCLPLSCGKLISYTDNDTCAGLEATHDLTSGDIRHFNPWVYFDCSNLAGASGFFGNILCAAPQNGLYTARGPGSSGDNTTPETGTGYTFNPVEAPENSTVADGITTKCGKWHVVDESDSCVSICLSSEIDIALLLEVNPSLGTEYVQGTPSLVQGNAYCTGPNYDWDVTGEP
ncbi:hypothetical protein EDB80DRAFT_677493 [Ilyonectria destructans]|nr:hypothetical protein EDB80DRAFT_677493 [Ilyonectria destructans]